MKRKTERIIVVAILIAIVGVRIGINCWKNRKVEFADENMAKVICGSIYGYGGNVTPENVTWEQLESIETLNIGYTGYYNTIKDIVKCKNLKRLDINNILRKSNPAYQIANGKIENLSEGDIEKLQKELQEVLPKLTELQEMWLADLGECKWTSVDFFRGCNKLERIQVWRSVASDYSALKECKALKVIELWDCNISSAEDIMGLENLEYITLANTPLGQNPQEVQKLKDAYPDVEIDIKTPLKEE